ncbi:hypothetical protein N0V82_009363 [Gnomoniopsis sp. IMI 355080]|nr:hypothetical protein N0V82_009363 [Gnomoniopsis sp. IMI 355080]
MNTNKNWGDKADKDLFFTILSVKNIGVISGSEWTTIGNHMRSMGYGFTNEGCRQHFQGLRRSQQKVEANGSLNDNNPRKIDPTTNPITRRPGPGRGRPRKSAANTTATAAAATATASASGSPADGSAQGPDVVDPIQEPQNLAQQISQQPLPPLPPQPNMDPGVGPAPTPMMESAPTQIHAPPSQSPLEIQTDGVFSEDASEEPEEHAAKRAKLEENHDPALNDEAMLSALAAHNNPDSMSHYNPDFYGEA